MKTMQQVLDQVVAHLRKQGARSMIFDPSEQVSGCMYRGQGGMKCAVGCLIDDKWYSLDLEGKLATDKAVKEALEKSEVVCSGVMSCLLTDLQRIHDQHDPNLWEAYFRALADEYKLRMPEWRG